MIRANVIASTKEGYDASVDEMYILGGKIAGECYLKGEYSDPKVSGNEAGKKRADNTAKNGHHSVFDHPVKTLELTGIPKILAMALNSLGMYTTSEKSGRYTEMTPDTPEEQYIYAKWVLKFSDIIASKHPEMSESRGEIEKLAQENARYAISIFTPTKLIYTASLRQWNYTEEWLKNLADKLGNTEISSESVRFNWRLRNSALELANVIGQHTKREEIHDIKGRKLDFLAYQVDSSTSEIDTEYYGDTYTAIYEGSWVQLAQSERHRVSRHTMRFNGVSNKFYTPPIIRGTKYEEEWLADLKSVADCIPQGTLVHIVERGYTEDFVLKMHERLCGRAQIEIMEQTVNTLKKMVVSNNISNKIKQELLKYINKDTGEVLTRCAAEFKCNEGCRWGAQKGLKRDI